MKDGIRQILGKTVSGVIVKESDSEPRSQCFLLFSDGSYYEMYGHIAFTNGLGSGSADEVKEYMSSRMKVVFEAYGAQNI